MSMYMDRRRYPFTRTAKITSPFYPLFTKFIQSHKAYFHSFSSKIFLRKGTFLGRLLLVSCRLPIFFREMYSFLKTNTFLRRRKRGKKTCLPLNWWIEFELIITFMSLRKSLVLYVPLLFLPYCRVNHTTTIFIFLSLLHSFCLWNQPFRWLIVTIYSSCSIHITFHLN